MKTNRIFSAAIIATALLAAAGTAMAEGKVAQPFANTTFKVENPGQVGYVGRKVAGPFDNTLFVIKNPGQPGFVKRGGDGGGIGGTNGIR